MARISEEVIERVKREVSLVRLVELAGIELRRQGKDLVGLCPFHEERTGSLVISPEKNLWHCMGACQAGGSVIDWTMRREGVSFPHAVELLRDGVAPTPVDGRRAVRSTVTRLPSPLAAGANDRELLERVVGFYAQTLRESPQALDYLKERGLAHRELVERFRLGYANRTLGYRLPAKNRKAGGELRGALQRLGVLRGSGHEHLSGSLVIPVFDEHGAPVQLYGRKIAVRGLRAGTALHLYLPGPRRGVFNREAFGAAGGELVVCESLIDALTFWAHGFRGVTACWGADGFTDEHQQAFTAAGVERVLIAFDRDDAGEQGARKLARRLGEEGVECFRVLFPFEQDANSFACQMTDAAGELALLLRNAVWMGAGKEPARPAPVPVHDGGGVALTAGALEHPLEDAPAQPASEHEDGTVQEDEQQQEPDGEATANGAGTADAGLLLAAEAAEQPSAPSLPVRPVRAAGPLVELSGDELHVVVDGRRWRVRGLAKASSFETLRVNVLVAREHPARGELFHVDSLDLYSARARGVFARQAGEELGLAQELIARDLGRVLLACEEHSDAAVRSAQAAAAPQVELSETERERALELLRDPALVERVLADFERVGVVGEQSNCLVGYLAAVSRKLDRPLAVMIQSTSAAGKSALQEAVLALIPEEERVSFSAMTGQSLFYMGETDLQHKVLAVAEEEGAERAAYALKLLQSEGELRIASTGKEGQTGRLVTHTYTVSGPVAIFLTTTTIDVDEELLNRCVVLSVDEEREQTRAIHERQRERETLEGLIAGEERAQVLALHNNAQRLLEPLAVVNPFARALTFSDARTRTRRDHMKYLTLIRAIALLHQHQRTVQSATVGGRAIRYIEASADDVRLANRLAHAVLGRSLDELPPGTRRLLALIEAHVERVAGEQGTTRERVRFTRRELREALGWGDTQLKVHLGRLASLELIWCQRATHGAYAYELAWDGQSEHEPHLPGLIDPDKLDGEPGCDYDANRSGQNADRAGAGRRGVGGRSGRGRPRVTAAGVERAA
jgi:DNA primase